MRRTLGVAALAFLAGVACGQTNAPAAPAVSRPRIGLALGGGGALGIAHVGVLRTLEEMRIPVDCIAGTSMGSIIGGLYAAGLSPDEIEDMLVRLDWWDVLKDRTPYRDLDFRRKEESARYLMDLELGLKKFRIVLPPGLAAGQKFNNLMQMLTVNAAGIEDFDGLNIPYRAVATDLRTGEAVVLGSGNLGVAMRASMAVPGAFTPVEIDGRLLVDGGLANNIPVDVVKAMGADIVIAVDVGASAVEAGKKDEFSSLGAILGRTYSIMQRPKDEPRRRAADILIEPDLVGYSASDFHRAAELAPRGGTAAKAHADALAELSVGEEEYAGWLARQRAKRGQDMTIRSVEIVGNRLVPTPVILKQVSTKRGDRLDFARIQKDVARIHGMGGFETVTHRLVPASDGGYDLKIDTREKYWGPGYLHFGLRLETDFEGGSTWSMLLNHRRAGLNDLGGEARLDLEVGRSQRGFLEWYQPLQNQGFFFVAPAVEVRSETQDIYDNEDKVAEYGQDLYDGRLDIGTQYKQYGEVRIGVFRGRMSAEPGIGATSLPSVDADMGAYTARLVVDRLDAPVFSRRGGYLRLEGFFARDEMGSDDEYDKLQGVGRAFASTGDHTFQCGLRAGHALSSDLPAYDSFTVGGMTEFAGLAQDELRGACYGVARAGYRYRLGRLAPAMGQGVYVLAWLDAGNAWMDEDEADLDDLIVGGAAGLALDTVFGPIGLAVGQAEGGRRQAYLTVGSVF